ncbi:Wee1-like protein kinase [Galdieria sulphuraria]|nr:Wee1-like protein kinase [Galdieria sulphuraria]
MMTPRRRKQVEREETSIENLTKSLNNEEEDLEPPPTPVKSPNHRARRRPRFFGTGQQTTGNLFSSPKRTNLSFKEDIQIIGNQQARNTLTSSKNIPQVDRTEKENILKTQEKPLQCLQNHVFDKGNIREKSYTTESCKPPLFPSSPTGAMDIPLAYEPTLKNQNPGSRNNEEDIERDNWMQEDSYQELCSPVTEQKKLQTDFMSDKCSTTNLLNTPVSCEKVFTCPYCHKKWREESRMRFSPSIRRCSLCSPIRTIANPAPCNMNPFSPEARSQGFSSPQEDTSLDMPASSIISCCSNVSKSLAFDSTSLLMSHSDSVVCNEQENDEFDNSSSEEDHLSFSAFSTGRLSSYKDDFEEIEEIGSGTFGKVFKCRQRLDGWLYAVKRKYMP